MGFMDKIKDIINVPDEDDDYEDQRYSDGYEEDASYEEEPYDSHAGERHADTRKASRGTDRRNYGYDDYDPNDFQARSTTDDNRNKVVNIHATAQLQVVLVKPERFDEAPEIADNLNNRRTVVLNLESCNRDVARRLVDFLSGVAYANSGQLKRIANSTFLITPLNVDITGDMLLGELENNGMFL